MISFIWLLDSNKEQQLIISKIAEINKINVKDQNYPLNEEIMEFNKNYEQILHQFNHFLYDFEEKSFKNITSIIKQMFYSKLLK